MELYAIKDIKANQFGDPFTAINEAVAIRRFFYFGKSATMIANDLELWKVGDFDLDSGVIIPANVFVCAWSDTLEGEDK